MHPQTLNKTDKIGPIRITNQLEGLSDIFEKEAEAVIWNRQIPSSVLSVLEALPTHDVDNGRFHVQVNEVSTCILALFEKWAWPLREAHQWLAHDVESLANHMGQILSLRNVLLRVELVRTDACRKFHRDTVTARLICTYSGIGTEIGVAENNDEPDHIENVPTGSPILLKGKLWPGCNEPSVLHRSPPIEEAGASRLMVVLNEAQ